ncbi:MAG: SusD/RagB family nutrient-binding outer membrane lipoprotein [Tannerella sp.]|nr:SusD/RagB family nutrient-binding outer membrane lipoprotein [Tannerella sp.]
MTRILNKSNRISKAIFLSVFLAFATLPSCTGDFENINTSPHGIPPEQQDVMQTFYTPMESLLGRYHVAYYQRAYSLNSDMYSGYMAITDNYGICNSHYVMNEGWNEYILRDYLTYIATPVNTILKATEELDLRSIAKILRVIGAHRVADNYGPMPYTEFGKGGSSVAYDDVETLYKTFLQELKESVDDLTDFVDNNPTLAATKRMAKFDLVNQGDTKAWILIANSLRLRLAMRISKVSPTLAKTEAEAAVSHKYGVLTASDPDMEVHSDRVTNALSLVVSSYNATRMEASIISILKGYNDPRLPKYSTGVGMQGIGQTNWYADSWVGRKGIVDADGNPVDGTGRVGEYIGVRNGIEAQHNGDLYDMYSAPNYNATNRNNSSIEGRPNYLSNGRSIIKVAEVFFLRAEGALRGWNMGGTPKELYEAGIKQSFDTYAIPDTEYQAYINNDSCVCADYEDPQHPEYNIAGIDKETVKWDESLDNERKLHKIINQKWLAVFPDGMEGWNDVRRTGYPKIFPVYSNLSPVPAPTGAKFIKRVTFYEKDKTTLNVEEVKKAIDKMGGSDNIWTRLWWDVNEDNVDGGNF